MRGALHDARGRVSQASHQSLPIYIDALAPGPDPRLVRIHSPRPCSATVPLRPPGLRSPLRAVNANTKPLAGCGFPRFLRKNHPVGDTMSD
jgi:hypothetical protein